MAYDRWSDSDVEKLRYAYQFLPTWEEIYNTFPGRKRDSIKYKAIALGLRRPDRIWREQDIEILKRLYPTVDHIEDVVKEIRGKTKSSIITKANRLNLSRPNNKWTEEEVETLKKMYPTCHYSEVRDSLDRTPGTIKVKAWSLGLKSKRNNVGENILESLTEADKGYLAGIIDGEGTVGYRKFWRDKHTSFAYTAYLSVANTNYKLIEWLNQKIAKRDYYVRHSDNRKTCYGWRIQGKYAMQVMREIAPYLILKREIAIKVADGHENRSNEEREELIEWVHKFNKRGVH